MVLLEAVRIWFGEATKNEINKVEVNLFVSKLLKQTHFKGQ